MDLRSDNILITPDQEVEFVDWPWAARGAAWLDMVQFLPTAVPAGHPAPSGRWVPVGRSRSGLVAHAFVGINGMDSRTSGEPPCSTDWGRHSVRARP